MEIGTWIVLVAVCLVFVALGLLAVTAIFPEGRRQLVRRQLHSKDRAREDRHEGQITLPQP